jgi:hypothetical protein
MQNPNKLPVWKRHLQLLVVLVTLSTLVLGLFQMLNPIAALGLMGKGEILPVTAHYFAMLGFFMVLVNGMVLHTIYEVNTSRTIILWAALQKAGIAVLLVMGILGGHFHVTAIGVALFDLAAGVLFFFYFLQLKKTSTDFPLHTYVPPTGSI